MKIVKHILQTADDPWRALMEWRASPNRDFVSPSERLYSRKIRTLVPMSTETLQPKPVNLEEIASARRERQQRMASTYDKGSKDLSTLRYGQPVLVKTVNDRAMKWRPGTILEPMSERSYLLQNDNGNIVRRNRAALQEIPDNKQMHPRSPTRTQPTIFEGTTTPRASAFKIKRNRVVTSTSESPQVAPETPPPNRTRSGREVKRPQKLSL